MNLHKSLHFLGFGIEVLGGFFLAVEAIKLKNLTGLREDYGEKFLRGPMWRPPDGATKEQIEAGTERRQYGCFLQLTGVGFIILALMALLAAGWVEKQWATIRPQFPEGSLGTAFVWFAVCVFALFLSCLAGFILYQIAKVIVRFGVKWLQWIEDKTDNGVIGILGFTLFSIGAIIRTWVTWPHD